MDCSHRPIPIPEPPPAPAPPAAAADAPQEAIGDSESDTPVSAAPTVGDHPSVADYGEDDDAESCSGGGGGGGRSGVVCAAIGAGDDNDEDDDVAMDVGGEDEVDSWMAFPWWRRTVVRGVADYGDAGGCAPPQEGGPVVLAGAGGHAAESNRLFWEACIAHGY